MIDAVAEWSERGRARVRRSIVMIAVTGLGICMGEVLAAVWPGMSLLPFWSRIVLAFVVFIGVDAVTRRAIRRLYGEPVTGAKLHNREFLQTANNWFWTGLVIALLIAP